MASELSQCEARVGLIVADERGCYYALAWADLERFRVPESFAPALAAIAEGGEPPADAAEVRGDADAPESGVPAFLGGSVRGWASRRARFAVRRLAAWELLHA